jgi:iron complex outermembrane receptor protein
VHCFNSAQSPIGDPAVPNLYAGDYVYTESGQYDTKQYALFGQVGYAFLDRLHASLGLRGTYAQTSTSVTQGGFFAVGNLTPYSKSESFNSTTPKFSLVYDLTSTATAYTAIGKGFRLGGELYTPLPTGPNNICAHDEANLGLSDSPSSSFGSDTLWSYELGTKGRTLGNALSFDVAGYYQNWTNLQQAIYLPTCGYYDTVNIGNAESYGAELEARYKLAAVPGLTFGVTAGSNHATLTSSHNPLTAEPGQHILYTPRWSATALLDYDHEIAGGVDGFVSWDYDFTGPSNGSYQVNNPNYNNPEYSVMNLTVGARFNSWELAAFAKNLLNNSTVIKSPTKNSLVTGYALQPLTAGLRVKRKF